MFQSPPTSYIYRYKHIHIYIYIDIHSQGQTMTIVFFLLAMFLAMFFLWVKPVKLTDNFTSLAWPHLGKHYGFFLKKNHDNYGTRI